MAKRIVKKTVTFLIVGLSSVAIYGLVGAISQEAINSYYFHLVDTGQYEEDYYTDVMRDPHTQSIKK